MIKRILAFFAVAVMSASLAACGGEGSCEKAVDHIVKLIEQDTAAKQAEGTEANREKLIEQCKKEGLNKRQEECVLAAKTLPDLNRCDRR